MGTALPFLPVQTVGSLSALQWKDSRFIFTLNWLSRESASWVLTNCYLAQENRSLSSVSPGGLALAIMPGLKGHIRAISVPPAPPLPHPTRLLIRTLCLYFNLSLQHLVDETR